jgi:inner membrane transporter RhtA
LNAPSLSSRTHALRGAALVLLGAASIQWSAALVKPAFVAIGPSASSSWRFLLGALVLLGVTRPKVRGWNRQQWLAALVLGATVALMNQAFYQAIARIPLGAAVAIEYMGPFLVAALAKRSLRHFVFVVLAGLGVLALSRPGGGITLVGALFAVVAGASWATYTFASHRVGGTTTRFEGLAVAMSFAALFTLPFGLGATHLVVSHPSLLGRLLLVGVMATVLGFGFEMQALRHLKPSIVSVLLALDPAVAFLFGWLLLHEQVTALDLVGLACVVLAGIGVTYDAAREDLKTVL